MLVSGILLLSGALAGCHGYSTPWPHAIYEDEPNGLACCPDSMGTLYVGESLHIRGSVDDCCVDVFDGFAFWPDDTCIVEFVLDADSSFADLDLGLYDPWTDTFTAIFDSPHNPETGAFLVVEPGRPFHLVVSSYSGHSGYSLWVDCLPFSYGPGSGIGGDLPLASGGLALAPSSLGDEAKADAASWFEYLPDTGARGFGGQPDPEEEDPLTVRMWIIDPALRISVELRQVR
jgi:hypothetical protein